MSLVLGHTTRIQEPNSEDLFYIVSCSCGMVSVHCKDEYSAEVMVRMHQFYQSCLHATTEAEKENGGWIPVFCWDDIKPK